MKLFYWWAFRPIQFCIVKWIPFYFIPTVFFFYWVTQWIMDFQRYHTTDEAREKKIKKYKKLARPVDQHSNGCHAVFMHLSCGSNGKKFAPCASMFKHHLLFYVRAFCFNAWKTIKSRWGTAMWSKTFIDPTKMCSTKANCNFVRKFQ